jgi:hypothetical protein
MKKPTIHTTDRQQLAKLWRCESDDLIQWQQEEMGAIYQHLLATPLVEELESVDPQLPEKLRQLETGSGEAPSTFGDLLTQRQPPVDLLKLVKRFGKRAHNEESLPADVATVLYVVAIAAALVRGQRITSADDRSLRLRIKWAASQPWITPATKELFEKALAQLSQEREA